MNTESGHPDTRLPLLYRAARRGVYGNCRTYGQAEITDALFVFLDGRPGPEAAAALEAEHIARPWVCLSDPWEAYIQTRYPCARVFRRYRMKPARRFRFPEERALPPGCRIAVMDEAAFDRHPFSHGVHYSSFAAFRAEGSGAAAWLGGEVVAAASSFLSLDGEVELDVSTQEAHRGKGLAAACIARMLRDCMRRASSFTGTRRMRSPGIWRRNSALNWNPFIRYTSCRRSRPWKRERPAGCLAPAHRIAVPGHSTDRRLRGGASPCYTVPERSEDEWTTTSPARRSRPCAKSTG